MGRHYVRDDRGSRGRHCRCTSGNLVRSGLTAVTRVGPPGVESVPPVITGIAIHPPTRIGRGSGSALDAHNKSGFSGCRSPGRDGCSSSSIWGTTQKGPLPGRCWPDNCRPLPLSAALKTLYGTSGGSDTKVPGPVRQIAGVLLPLQRQSSRTRGWFAAMTELLETDEFRAHDQLIRRLSHF